MSDPKDLTAEFQAMADAAIAALEGKAPAGPPKCHVCNAAEVKRAGEECPPCHEAERRRKWAEFIANAKASLPEDKRAVTGERIKAQVTDPAVLAKMRTLHSLARKRELPSVVTFTGKPGAGKTTCAAYVFLQAMAPSDDVDAPWPVRAYALKMRYMAATRLIRALDESRFGETPEEWEQARAATLLILDEFGRFGGGGDRRAMFFDLLELRIGRGRPTIITTPILSADAAEACQWDGGVIRRVFVDAFRVDLPGGEWRPAGQT